MSGTGSRIVRPFGLWRLEWMRLTRTSRWVILAAAYVGFGVLGPVTARYMAELLKSAGGSSSGITITIDRPPVPSDGIDQFVGNTLQIGTLLFLVVAAGALAFDAIPEMGVFLRTRVPSARRILAPRLVLPLAVASAAWVAGTAAAWYETAILIGPLPVKRMLLGVALGVVFLAFATAVVAAVAQWARGTLSTVIGSLAVLLVLPIASIWDPIGRWLPTKLGAAIADLVSGRAGPSEYVGPSLVAAVAIVVLLWLAEVGAKRREA